ncbi:hypothetical protein DX980_01535 [Burkholderia gladioli]|uniref:hypothetical protein n=1 Tax=Burkholderia gladioli TaxID=28095 RepID=UPI00136496AB|nr:hypothetical protein [Burkholderia gladioli]WAG17961.1 hypothetical protein DX980_01045 [Burkholderia gladioli]WAG18040.1 hypothetical protein DX980_01535 [Burkholderia gladioli]
MVWKTEQWMRDVFPGGDKIYVEYRQLPRRELAIVVGAALDAALAELLSKRLHGSEPEIHSFLGVNGDGRAPCASFGARIQLSLLTTIISQNDAIILRAIKGIRNQFAHEVRADYNSPSLLPLIFKLHDQFLKQSNSLIEAGHLSGSSHSLDLIRPFLATTPEAGAGLLLAVFSTYQAYFHRLYERIQPVPPLELFPRA